MPPKKSSIDITSRALPPRNPAWSGVKAKVTNGPSVLHARPALSCSAASRAKGELFGRINPSALLRLLAPSLSSSDHEEKIGSTFREGPSIATVEASASSPTKSPVLDGDGEAVGKSEDIIVLDIRPSEAESAVAAVRIAGALHCPFSTYMCQDRLPPAMHAARRQTPQPVIVLYDDCTGRIQDGPEFAQKLIQAGRYDAVMVLEGGLRACAQQCPQVLEGMRVEDYIAGVTTEIVRNEGGHGEKLKNRVGPLDVSGSPRGAHTGVGGSLPHGGGGSMGTAMHSVKSGGTFGSSRRF